jgi:hypothetical protein
MPAAKHPDARMGHRSKAEQEYDELVPDAPIEPRQPDPGWDPIAIRMFNSFVGAPQAKWFLASDWEMASMLSEALSRELKPQFVGMSERWNSEAQTMEKIPVIQRIPMKAATLASLIRGYGNLLATVADRRSLSFEVGPVSTDKGGQGGPDSSGLALVQGGLTG